MNRLISRISKLESITPQVQAETVLCLEAGETFEEGYARYLAEGKVFGSHVNVTPSRMKTSKEWVEEYGRG